MRKLGQRGVAALTAVVIIAVSTGAAVATPVVVDAADVDPDHPLYALERLGERIRRVGDDDQMQERFEEYQRMVMKGKALKYRAIHTEFREKMEAVEITELAPSEEVNLSREVAVAIVDNVPFSEGMQRLHGRGALYAWGDGQVKLVGVGAAIISLENGWVLVSANARVRAYGWEPENLGENIKYTGSGTLYIASPLHAPLIITVSAEGTNITLVAAGRGIAVLIGQGRYRVWGRGRGPWAISGAL
jgi:hypothetical protein